MKKCLFMIFVFVLALLVSGSTMDVINLAFHGETLLVNSSEGIKVKADVYEIEDKKAPVILLFHQAGFSRGEYRETAPRLNKLGFHCIAVDQRSGRGVNGVVNETALMAADKGLGVQYADAFPDLEATLRYARQRFPSSKIFVWGSSYSASLVFVLAQKYPDQISAVAAFSPGEYFKFQGKEIKDYAESVKCPVFITSAKKEYENWKVIYNIIPKGEKSFFLPESNGVHGSRALWKSSPGHQAYWEALTRFLNKL